MPKDHALLDSDICECGDFKSQHKPTCFCGCLSFRFFHRASEKDATTWAEYHKPKDPAAVKLGRKGGRVRSEAKKASGKANMAKARAAKEAKRTNPSS